MTTSVSTTTSTTTTSQTSYSQNRNEFDTDALVEEAVAAKLARADSYETKLTTNETKIAAYQDMQDQLLSLQESLDALRAPTGSSSDNDDVFENRTAYLTSSTSTDASSILSATVDDGVDIGTHEIEVSQVAKVAKLGGGSMSSRSDDLGWEGSFTLGTSEIGDTTSETSATISITATMSLDDIADAINAKTTQTGVSASVIKVAEDDYMIVLTGEETNRSITATADSGDDILNNLGITASDGSFANELQAAQSAKLTVDGVQVERSSNDIDDILDGITLHLYRAEADNTLSLEIDNDLTSVEEAIQTLVDTYNTFRDFVLQNQDTNSDGTVADGATLFGDATLRSISTSLQKALTSSIDETSLALLGITFDSDNKLELDTTTLENALLDDFDAIQALFSYQMESSSGDLMLLSQGSSSQDFTLDVTVDSDGNLSGASVGGDSSLFTISGQSIIGNEGTAYEGLTLVYTGSQDQSMSVSISRGIAAAMYDAIETVADEDNGTLTDLVTSLEDANTDLQTRIDTITSNAEDYRTYLLDQYGRVEAKLAEAQTVLDLLEALNNSSSSDS